MLGIALALVFAGASGSNAGDRIQHQPGMAVDHDHLLLSDISFAAADHHDEQPNTGDLDGDAVPDHQPGTGHHHGDSGSGVALFTAGGLDVFDQPGNPHGISLDRMTVGLSTHGPERPPKAITTSA